MKSLLSELQFIIKIKNPAKMEDLIADVSHTVNYNFFRYEFRQDTSSLSTDIVTRLAILLDAVKTRM